jgi:hypothetical protein
VYSSGVIYLKYVIACKSLPVPQKGGGGQADSSSRLTTPPVACRRSQVPGGSFTSLPLTFSREFRQLAVVTEAGPGCWSSRVPPLGDGIGGCPSVSHTRRSVVCSSLAIRQSGVLGRSAPPFFPRFCPACSLGEGAMQVPVPAPCLTLPRSCLSCIVPPTAALYLPFHLAQAVSNSASYLTHFSRSLTTHSSSGTANLPLPGCLGPSQLESPRPTSPRPTLLPTSSCDRRPRLASSSHTSFSARLHLDRYSPSSASARHSVVRIAPPPAPAPTPQSRPIRL